MLITSYNPNALGDVLITIIAEDEATQTYERKANVTVITGESGQILGYNFFDVSTVLTDLEGNGQVALNADQVAKLNAAAVAAGFDGVLAVDAEPKFVIGVIAELADHPDSDHLHVAQVDLGVYTKQIVCGAPNAELGQHVIAALPGAMMPTGKIIWPGALRGIDSYGMLCAARELDIPGAPAARGILIMPNTIPAGTPFDMAVATKIVAEQNAAQ